MEVEENQTLSSANRETLRKTTSWINFFVVALYVICGLVVLALIMIMSESRRPPYMGETFLGIGFVVIGILVFYATQLTKYVKSIKEAVTENNINLITKGLSGYKNFFVTSAILSALVFILMLIGFLAAFAIR
jgi:protein-S-isoprenylcysteine O-methyltransferase Ste14